MEEMNVMAFTEFGAPDVLRPMKREVPKPQEGELLVKVKCASFNPSDALVRKGAFKKIISLDPLHVPGVDFSGLIVAIGPHAERFKMGERVYGYLDIRRNGSYEEYVTLLEEDACKIPRGLTFEEAASIPLSYLTAYQALMKNGTLKQGQSILIYGATGGVGLASIALAKTMEAKIYAVAGTESLSLLEGKGLQKTMDYKKENILEDMPTKVDVLLNLAPLKKEDMVPLLSLLQDQGTFVSTTGVPDLPEGSGITLLSVQTKRNKDHLAQITKLLEENKITSLRTSTWPITDAALVHRLHEEGKLLGKAVFQVEF
jgi:NADPH:quinone reductase-like Zn-dependent oxidoreductase